MLYWQSIPQKLLHIVEEDEISQLRKTEEGREVLIRNGFYPLHINNGFRTLKTFKILVGEKNSMK